MQCPNCKTDRAHRSHRKRAREYLASLAGHYPYRCRNCQHRFLRSRHANPQASPTAHPSTEREIRASRRARDWKRKKRNLMIYSLALVVFLIVLYSITRDRTSEDNGNSSLMQPAIQAIA